MALTILQRQLYQFRVDLYAPIDYTETGGYADMATYPDVPTFQNVACNFDSTPEVDMPATQGRTKEVNIFTLDHFYFDTAQLAGDNWFVRITNRGLSISMIFWKLLGNSQPIENPSPLRQINEAHYYAKRNPGPANVIAALRLPYEIQPQVA
jgi:hypothetical protein